MFSTLDILEEFADVQRIGRCDAFESPEADAYWHRLNELERFKRHARKQWDLLKHDASWRESRREYCREYMRKRRQSEEFKREQARAQRERRARRSN